MTTPNAVLDRYDALHDLVAATVMADAADAPATLVAAAVLAREARLLDTGRFEEWLAAFTDDAVLWVPLRPDAHPAHDQSLFLDDRRRLSERVARTRDPSAWAQSPPSIVVRVVGSVEAWPDGPAAMVARSAVAVSEHRGPRVRSYAGHQVHRLVARGDGWAIDTKVVLLAGLASGTDNLGFLL